MAGWCRVSYFVFFHNHPSDAPPPSAEDIAFTRRMDLAGRLLGIKMVDAMGAARCPSSGGAGDEPAEALRSRHHELPMLSLSVARPVLRGHERERSGSRRKARYMRRGWWTTDGETTYS